MTFPRWGGFSGPERQASDQFARCIVALALLDAAEALPGRPEVSQALRGVARDEAELLAERRLQDRQGGWSYFPELPELPPDLDSLSAALALFARVAPAHLALCDGPVELALQQQRADGSCPIWLIHPEDPGAARERMQRSVQLHWGDTPDVDVNARFAAALACAGRSAEAARVSAFVQSQQQADGLWPATWYWSALVPTELALTLPGTAAEPARATLRRTQQADGGWGAPDATTQETALAVWLLAGHDDDACARGVAWLCDNQTRRGAWRASPWIRMDIGRAAGRSAYCARFGCEAVETALALRALARCLPCL
jgi:squalene-hopene/tetraprenyl-beta-curcumene cyclase